MFETLADRFDAIFRRLRSRGHLNEADVDEVAREIRLALLEADVNVRVVKSFVNRLKARAERRKGAGTAIESPATGTLKPWREVVTPHPDSGPPITPESATAVMKNVVVRPRRCAGYQ